MRGKRRGGEGKGGDRKGREGKGKGGERREERGRTVGGEGKREGDAPLTQIPGSAPGLSLSFHPSINLFVTQKHGHKIYTCKTY